ncbi:MAG: extracellular solute-binding protein, partial [Armatimonadetes bacterium]|nr:extracellular solute-binding protein [Armatimonadota bacterium]
LTKMLTYVNADHSAMPWQDAIEYMISGQAAFLNVQGDWVDGWRSAVDRDLSHIGRTAPVGLQTRFLYNTDTWALPKGAPNRENALDLLRVFGSKEGQESFAPNKGAVPARGDVDLSLFNDYLQSDIADFFAHDLYPSVAHGVATSESWRASVLDEINLFASTGDVAKTQANLQALADEELARQ